MDFQNVHPETVISAAELLGNLAALNMPFNVQNLWGNWLTLAGQAILTFNAQQQYFENGPGRCYGQDPSKAAQDDAELAALRAEVQSLRAEVAALRTLMDNWQQSDSARLWREICALAQAYAHR